jgi:sulfite reductase (ferredoxin)
MSSDSLPADNQSVSAAAPKLTGAETTKRESRHLRGSVSQELTEATTPFTKPATLVLKFHGIYQQENRDLRKTSSPKLHSSMVRVSIPGGQLSPSQYLQLEGLADNLGDGSLRITSRGGIQYHQVAKTDLPTLMKSLNQVDLSTLAACGDVVRNVVSCSAPVDRPDRGDIQPYVELLNRNLKPQSGAYAEIWLDGEKAISVESESEPLYGDTYLPRKFKIGFAFAGDNTTDIYSHDLGYVAHFEQGTLLGFTLLAGGGMGQTNNMKATFPRMADEICFIPAEDILTTAKAAVTIHRDFGDRTNRKHARLKYVLAERGADWFRKELESRCGKSFADAAPLQWHRHADYFGWHAQQGGGWFYGLRIISGRMKLQERAAVKEIVTQLQCQVALTPQQNILFCGLQESQKAELEAILQRHGIATAATMPPVLRHSMACPALPLCGLSLSESERVMPDVAASVQQEFDAVGLPSETVHLRMTGCPNGCARPYTAEIGVVGMSVNLYSIYLGGSPNATRLATLYKHGVRGELLGETIRPIVERFKTERQPQEAFGDFCHRIQTELH